MKGKMSKKASKRKVHNKGKGDESEPAAAAAKTNGVNGHANDGSQAQKELAALQAREAKEREEREAREAKEREEREAREREAREREAREAQEREEREAREREAREREAREREEREKEDEEMEAPRRSGQRTPLLQMPSMEELMIETPSSSGFVPSGVARPGASTGAANKAKTPNGTNGVKGATPANGHRAGVVCSAPTQSALLLRDSTVPVTFRWEGTANEVLVAFDDDWSNLLTASPSEPNVFSLTRFMRPFRLVQFLFRVDGQWCLSPSHPSHSFLPAHPDAPAVHFVVPVCVWWSGQATAVHVAFRHHGGGEGQRWYSEPVPMAHEDGGWVVRFADTHVGDYEFKFVADGCTALSQEYATTANESNEIQLQLLDALPPPFALAPPVDHDHDHDHNHDHDQWDEANHDHDHDHDHDHAPDNDHDHDHNTQAVTWLVGWEGAQGSDVVLKSEADGWGEGVRVEQDNGVWMVRTCFRSWNPLAFKFVIDGNWTSSAHFPTVGDAHNNEAMAVELHWAHGGSDVRVATELDNWAVQYPTSREGPFNRWRALVPPRDSLQFKFVVDGEWMVSLEYDQVTANATNNNVVHFAHQQVEAAPRPASGEGPEDTTPAVSASEALVSWLCLAQAQCVELRCAPNWDTPLLMDQVEAGTWALSMPCPAFHVQQFKFVVDGEWKTLPDYPEYHNADGTVNNFVVPVRLVWPDELGGAGRVCVASSLDDWKDQTPMQWVDGVWVWDAAVVGTDPIQFKFVVDGKWLVSDAYDKTEGEPCNNIVTIKH